MSPVSEFIENDVVKLDQVDRAILSYLQIDGRSSASYISEKIGMSVPAVTDRIKKLNDLGVIKGFTTLLDYRKSWLRCFSIYYIDF